MKTKLTTFRIGPICLAFSLFHSCKKEEAPTPTPTYEIPTKLSDLKMYTGNPYDLTPSADYTFYDESSMLFTDSCEKQRLMKIPAGTKMTINSNGLPIFPAGTILAKTFFYYNDVRDHSKGKIIFETRILIYTGTEWIGGTYEWNNDYSDGTLIVKGANRPVTWIDDKGATKSTLFHIADTTQCFSCHKSDNKIIPIGPRVKSLNMNVTHEGVTKNQLAYFEEKGILNPTNPALYITIPDWKDTTATIENRARAYMDINCAYCHNPTGIASYVGLDLEYEKPIAETGIKQKKGAIKFDIEYGTMPKVGSTMLHKEVFPLIFQFLDEVN